MSAETTRRQFIQAATAGAALTVLAPSEFARAQTPPLPELPGPSIPVGPTAPYSAYQSEIYISGMSAGVKPIFTTNLSDLEAAADTVLSPDARRHFLSWAGGANAAGANLEALRAWRIVPRMFIDRAERDLSATILGVEMPVPIILGPVGGQGLAHPDAEQATARAPAGLGLTYVHSSQASKSVESVALAAPTGSRWFAIDWPGSGSPDAGQLDRARLAGCSHLVLSPPQRSQSWEPLAAVRAAWSGPIVLGGIQTAADARQAVDRGVDGIVVSDERARRGPKPRGTLDALPEVVDAVGSRVPVLFGSGVRTGSDVFKALALGAEAVVIGRPYVHGLALAGQDGVRHMLRTLLAELDITLAIAGVSSYRDLDAGALSRS